MASTRCRDWFEGLSPEARRIATLSAVSSVCRWTGCREPALDPWAELASGGIARDINTSMQAHFERRTASNTAAPMTEQDFGSDGFPISRRDVDSYYEELPDSNRVSKDSATVYWDDDTAAAVDDFDALLVDVGAARDAIRPRREDRAASAKISLS